LYYRSEILPPPHPDDELELPDVNLDDLSDDSKFNEWNEVFIADKNAEVLEEQAECGAKEQFKGDPEQMAMLTSFNTQRDQRIWEQVR
jgi:hypothetical protein